MIAIYKKEMHAYLTNMMGYVFLAFLLLIIGIQFTMNNLRLNTANFQMALEGTTIFFIMLIPTLTMRLFSEEARQKTDQLLFTSPLTVLQIVIGKYFAAATLFLLTTAISAIMPLMVNHYADLPVSQVIGAYVGFLLLGAASIAVGVFVSVLTDNQIIAAVLTVASIFVMFVMDFVAEVAPTTTFTSFIFVIIVVALVIAIWYNATRHIIATLVFAIVAAGIAGGLYLFDNMIYHGIIVRALLWFSIFTRFYNFTEGIIHIRDIVYYISFIALFVYLSVNVIEKRRWR